MSDDIDFVSVKKPSTNSVNDDVDYMSEVDGPIARPWDEYNKGSLILLVGL